MLGRRVEWRALQSEEVVRLPGGTAKGPDAARHEQKQAGTDTKIRFPFHKSSVRRGCTANDSAYPLVGLFRYRAHSTNEAPQSQSKQRWPLGPGKCEEDGLC